MKTNPSQLYSVVDAPKRARVFRDSGDPESGRGCPDSTNKMVECDVVVFELARYAFTDDTLT